MDLLPQLYIIVLGKKTADGFREIKKLTVDETDNVKRYQKKSYDYQLEWFQHHKGRRHYAYYDKDSGEHIDNAWVQSSDVNPEDSDTRNARGLVKAGVDDATSNYGLAMVIMAAVAGLGGGLFIGYLVAGMM